jgi:hypothetical protein
MPLVSTNSRGCFVVTFPALHIFCIYQTYMFCNSHEIHFGTTGKLSFVKTCVY